MKVSRIVIVLIAAAFFVYFLFPIYWTFITSIKQSVDIFSYPPVFFPTRPTFENYYAPPSEFGAVSLTALNSIPYMVSSFAVGIITTLAGTFLIGAPAAYSIVRFAKGGKTFSRMILFMIMVPAASFIIPFFQIIIRLHLIDTWWGLALSYLSFTVPFATWMMMGYFYDLPVEVEEAALVDGVSRMRAFYDVAMKMVTPGLTATSILGFITCWNEFLYALILTFSPYNFSFPPVGAQTVPVFISSFVVIEKSFAWGGLAAAGLFTALPSIILGLYAQKYLARGLTLGAVKG
ncbi:MAG: carbohydrate ABC transporter permease [Conexivisphaerales archaeon]